MPTEQEYWDALQAKVCVKCVDGDGKGECRIAGGTACALQAYLPQIIQTINSVYSHSIVPYEEQLREHICSACVHQSADGHCQVRKDVACALDRYFPLIVQVIEETQLKKRLQV